MAEWYNMLSIVICILFGLKSTRAENGADVDIVRRLLDLEKVQRQNQDDIQSLGDTVNDQKDVIAKQALRISDLQQELETLKVSQRHGLAALKVSQRHQSKQLQRQGTLLQALLRKTLQDSEVKGEDRNVSGGQSAVRDDANDNDGKLDHTTTHQSIGQSDGHLSMAKRQGPEVVAFTVYLDHDETLGQSQVVKFNRIITNEGSGYNLHTGVFTCVTPGVYMFHVAIGERDTNQFVAALKVNSQNVVDALAQTNTASDDDQGSNMAIVKLNQGDSVWVDSFYNSRHVEGSTGLRLTTFSGVLISI